MAFDIVVALDAVVAGGAGGCMLSVGVEVAVAGCLGAAIRVLAFCVVLVMGGTEA